MYEARILGARRGAIVWLAAAVGVALVMTMLGAPGLSAAPVREAAADGYHEGPWRRVRCTFTDCDRTATRGSLSWGLSETDSGLLLTSYGGGYKLRLRWVASRGEYDGVHNTGRWWRRRVVLHVTDQELIDGTWTATTLEGTTKVWSKNSPRYFETGRFTLHRRFGFGRLVFQTDQDLAIMDEDGTDTTHINGICEGFEPSWRPGTQRIAFIHRCGASGTFDVSTIHADGTGLEDVLATGADDFAPDWSHDGTQMVLNSNETGNTDVYIANANGSGLTNLTMDPAADVYPAISPDGTRIVFTSDRDGDYDIYVMDVDGTNVEQLTDNAADDGTASYGWGGGPVWSPNGNLIAFESDRTGEVEIYTLSLGSGQLNRLTFSKGSNVNPAFSPDGKRIAFASDRGRDFDIYTMGIHGEDVLRVSGRQGNQYQPDWVS